MSSLQSLFCLSSLTPLLGRIKQYEQISKAVPSDYWKRMVVDKLHYPLQFAVMIRAISEATKETLLACVDDLNSLVIPALTLLAPGFVTQYGVWYVQYIVPQAYSLRALHRQHRQGQRVLYFKFWALYGIIAGPIARLNSLFWWLPLFTHLTFITWCFLVLPRVINTLYGLWELELQLVGLLPQPEGSSLTIQDSKLRRASSTIIAFLPTANDVKGKSIAADADNENSRIHANNSHPKDTDDNKLSSDDTQKTVVDDAKDESKLTDTAVETDSKSGSNTDKENQVQPRNGGRDKKSSSVTKKSGDGAEGSSKDAPISARLRRRST